MLAVRVSNQSTCNDPRHDEYDDLSDIVKSMMVNKGHIVNEGIVKNSILTECFIESRIYTCKCCKSSIKIKRVTNSENTQMIIKYNDRPLALCLLNPSVQ